MSRKKRPQAQPAASVAGTPPKQSTYEIDPPPDVLPGAPQAEDQEPVELKKQEPEASSEPDYEHEVEEFWLTKTRYVQQIGEGGPSHVFAAPVAPVKVRLRKYVKRQRREMTTDRHGRAKAGRPIDEFEWVLHPEDDNLKRVKPLPPVPAHRPSGAPHPSTVRRMASERYDAPDPSPEEAARASDR